MHRPEHPASGEKGPAREAKALGYGEHEFMQFNQRPLMSTLIRRWGLEASSKSAALHVSSNSGSIKSSVPINYISNCNNVEIVSGLDDDIEVMLLHSSYPSIQNSSGH